MADDYKRVLQKARKDLEAALQEKEELDARIAGLRQTIAGLAALSGEPYTVPDTEATPGISHGIRRVLATSPNPLTAPEIRDALARKPEFRTTLESYANPLSVIHNTLARLVRQNEVVQTDNKFSLKDK